MEERFIELGGEKFKIIVNFKNCYRLTKFRNRLETNIDFSNADEEILKDTMEGIEGELEDKAQNYAIIIQELQVLIMQ